jgi:hypothetical protein
MPIRISRERKGDLLLECARLHYIDKLNKTEIAAWLLDLRNPCRAFIARGQDAASSRSPSDCRRIMTNSKPSCKIVLGSSL